MSEIVRALEERIRRLKTDIRSTKSWMELRREIERRAGRWAPPGSGIVFELRDGVIYQYLSDRAEGVSELTITALDAPVPYVAQLHMDLQGTPPEKRKAIVRQLDEEAAKMPPAAQVEIIAIVPGDWLSKISKARWGDVHAWKTHLRPTEQTLKARRARGEIFNPNLIYEGDTFEVIA